MGYNMKTFVNTSPPRKERGVIGCVKCRSTHGTLVNGRWICHDAEKNHKKKKRWNPFKKETP